MWRHPLDYIGLEDCGKLHEPDDQEFVSVSAEGGHIGRVYWHNQCCCMIEQFNADETLYRRQSWEILGNFAMIDPIPTMKNQHRATPTISQTKHFPNLDFTVCATAHTHCVDFVVYDIEAWQEGATPGVYDMPLWHKAGAPSHPDPVNCIEEAEPYLHGKVKWDGCSNWHFDEQDRVMLHGCGRHDVLRFGAVMATCWDWAAELCPAWNP